MSEPQFLSTKQGRTLAYHKTEGEGIGIVFLGGFKSDMDGSKALYLEGWAKQNNRPFLRFDYSGHGKSSELFVDGCIGDWAADAMTVISKLTDGPQILVGSSMGGWISLLICRDMPEKVAGFIGIAAAPDFTEDSMWDGFNEQQRDIIQREGQLALPSEYSDEPYIITKKLIEDGRDQLVLRTPLEFNFPVRLLQGTADADVDMSVALRLLEHLTCDDAQLVLVKGADHRFSDDRCLEIITDRLSEVLGN